MASDEPWPLITNLTLGALPTAPACLRAHAKQMVWEWGLAMLADTTELIVSELATNAVKAAQALEPNEWRARRMREARCVSLRLSSDHKRVLIELWDANPEPPAPTAPDVDGESGRGLLIVEALSDQWGYYHPDSSLVPTQVSPSSYRQPRAVPAYSPGQWLAGKVVWCEIAADSPPDTSTSSSDNARVCRRKLAGHAGRPESSLGHDDLGPIRLGALAVSAVPGFGALGRVSSTHGDSAGSGEVSSTGQRGILTGS